jgi:3-deoxy-D-arabino-heptulosonate 7-phosphate (DAHP) synthase class II
MHVLACGEGVEGGEEHTRRTEIYTSRGALKTDYRKPVMQKKKKQKIKKKGKVRERERERERGIKEDEKFPNDT